jgi:hypothetical protein
MTDEQNPALEAGDEVVDAVEVEEAAEVAEEDVEAESPDTETEEQPSEADEKVSKSKERRERRKRELDGMREQVKAAEQSAREAAEKLEHQKKVLAELPLPKPEDYGKDYERYQAALSAYQTLNVIDGREVQRLQSDAERAKQAAAEAARLQQAETAKSWQDHMADGREKYADFMEVVVENANLPISAEVAEMVATSDIGADVAYFLGKNPDKARELSSLGALERARAFGRIEAVVSAPKPKTVTSAPKPIRPVNGSATPAKDVERMSPSEYREWRANGGTF